MKDKTETLSAIRKLIEDNDLTRQDVDQLFNGQPAVFEPEDQLTETTLEPSMREDSSKSKKTNRTTASDTLFTIGAIIIFAAVAIFVGQVPEDQGFTRISISILTTALFWFIAVRLLKQPNVSEQLEGVAEASLLAGSLSSGMTVLVVLNELFGVNNFSGSYEAMMAISLAVLAIVHYLMDLVVRKDVTIIFTALLATGSYLWGVAALASDLISDIDFWAVVAISAGFMLIAYGQYLRKTAADRDQAISVLWAVGGFIILLSAYIRLFDGPFVLLWTLLFPLLLYTAFMISIKYRSKNFLVSGSLFLFAFVMTIAIKYFGDGLGMSGALLVGGILVVGSGVLVTSIKRKYFA